ncbi:hypothetical protein ACHAWF_012225 [Thalassiosira exigua]
MVLQLLLPREGGGSLRRFLGIRRALFQDRWNDPRPLRGPATLFDFRREDDAADVRAATASGGARRRGSPFGFGGWRASDDGVIGGYSTSDVAFHEGSDLTPEEGGGESPAPASSSSCSPPFLRWSGTLSTKVNRTSHLARNVTRSGFAAILSAEYPLGASLENKYQALEICCRTDGRTYAVNLHVESYFPDDIYQGFIGGGGEDDEGKNERDSIDSDARLEESIISEFPEQEQPLQRSLDVREYTRDLQRLARESDPDVHPYHGHPPLGFRRFIMPFRDFALTSGGRLRQQQRILDDVTVQSIGFTLMDGIDGDFTFDLVSLRAVNVLEGEVVGRLEDDERMDEGLRARLRPKKKTEDEDEDKEKVGATAR